MSRLHAQRLAECFLLLFVAGSILWRGGKSVDATWALGIVTIVVLAASARLPFVRSSPGSKTQPMTVPLPLWGILLFFVTWSALSFLTSATRTYGLDEIVRDASCVLLFLWIVRRAGNPRTSALFDGFLWTVAVAGAVAVLFGLAVYVFQPVNRFVGSFLDWRFHTDYWPNAWAQFALLAWPLAALLAGRAATAFNRWACAGAAGLLVGSLFLSYSRGGFLAFAGQVALLTAFWGYLALRDVRVTKAASQGWKPAVATAVAALAVAFALFGTANALRSQRYDVQSVGDKVAFRAAEGTSSIDERAQFFGQALELSLERPLLGYGPYSFRFAQPHLMQDVFATSDHPHNVFLKYAAERGWPTVIAFLAFLAYVIGLSLRHLFLDRKTDWSIGNDASTIALLVAVLGVLAHNLIDYNLQFVGIALPFWIALALLSVHLAEKRPISRASFAHWRISRALARIEGVAAVILLVIVAWEGSFLVVSSLGRRAEARGEHRQALAWYERATPEWFSRDLLLARARLLEQEGLLDEADAALEDALRENAVDPRAWRIRAELATRRGQSGMALQYAEHAYRLGRYTDLGIVRVLLETSIAAGQEEALKARKEEFDTLFTAYAEAINGNIHFIALGGSVEELDRVAALMARLFPTDKGRYEKIAEEAAEHAEVERASFAARPTGLLW
jgi:O-antigen ligase